jgi:peptidoglycan/xylan/chitin deacetylase (PgdA/CDA1 family)
MISRQVAVLGYHKLGPPPEEWWSWQYVPLDVFETQILSLREEGWTAISADDLVRGLDGSVELPERSFLVTFDDAYESLASEATVDCFERLGLRSVVFAPTEYVGGWNRFDHDIEPREPICDWPALREIARRGVSVQSHGRSHRTFSSLSISEQLSEAADSKRVLEAELGSPVRLLAYPYGDPGAAELPDGLRRSGYDAAFVYGGGAFELPVTDRYRLPRLAMGPDTAVLDELGG